MNKLIFSALFCLVASQMAMAQDQFGTLENSNKLTTFNPADSSYSSEQLDENGLMARGIGRVPVRGPGHGPVIRPPIHRPPVWRPHPGWRAGWTWNRGWRPTWWRVGIVFPAWIWINAPVGYWQCTAFNPRLQSFSAFGPDVNQAAYGALYACGGPNYQAMGCYIPAGYCQVR
jgi:hypothetical protein